MTTWLIAWAPWLPPKTSRVFALAECRLGDLEKGFADWHTGHFAAAEVASGFGEVHGGSRDQRRDQAIGESGNEVRLKYESGNSAQYRRQHGRAGGVSADADHDVGPKLGKNAARIPYGSGKIEECFQPRCQAHVVQRANLD